MAFKSHFSRFLGAQPQRLHLCAHSHHPWPDVSFEAQQQAWLDAATLADDKWHRVFGEILPQSQHHLARLLNLPDPKTICFGANTHEFLTRLLSSIEARPFRVLTTDCEFMSFSRQISRLVEAGYCELDCIDVEPIETFTQRFAEAARIGGHHLVYFSHVFYNSGYCVPDLAELVHAVPSPRSVVVIDGYHGFMAVPTDLSRVAARAFYVSGGYKYAMSGEGAAFMHCPPGQIPRPLNTGWFAGFDTLHDEKVDTVRYTEDGSRFWGATFDPTALYRFNAVMDWVRRHQVTVAGLQMQVRELQRELLDALDARNHPVLHRRNLLAPSSTTRGNFLGFRHPLAIQTQKQLAQAQVLTDARGEWLRIGFGLYHDTSDIAELLRRLDSCNDTPN